MTAVPATDPGRPAGRPHRHAAPAHPRADRRDHGDAPAGPRPEAAPCR